MKNIRNNILFLTIGIVISVSISYCFADTLIDSKDVYYKDSRELGYNNVQDAIDGTCIRFDNAISNLKQELLNQTYPIGSIYISTTLDTNEKVGEALGGTWEVYGNGRTLLSSTGESEKTGGSTTTTLTIDNLPEHTHDISHTHTTAASSITNGKAANTTSTWYLHAPFDVGDGTNTTMRNVATSGATYNSSLPYTMWKLEYTNTHSHTVTGTIPSLSTNSISTTTSGAVGKGKSFSIQDPYITVYMYKRIA